MEETFKFPGNGYEVKVVRKQDVIDCIEDNILDKELALEIVKRCEIDAVNFIKQGRWTGIPFIGNIRIPKTTTLLNSEQQQELLTGAKENYNKEQYVMFRRQLCADNEKRVRQERLFNYTVSMLANRYPRLYKKLVNEKGVKVAQLILFTFNNLNVVNEEHLAYHCDYYGDF